MNDTHTTYSRPSAADRGYDNRWRVYARGFLKRNPLCVICKARGVTKASECVDHKVAHKLDPVLFWDIENHQAACLSCNSRKAVSEGRWKAKSYTMPEGLLPSLVPLVIVCGAPGSGKDTYVRNNMGANDLVINADDICVEMLGKRMVQAKRRWVPDVFAKRNDLLRSLGVRDGVDCDRAWLVVSAPTIEVREFLRDKLEPEDIVMMLTSHAECVRRIVNDDSRRGFAGDSAAGVTQWYTRFDGVTANEAIVEG